jgi:hypothetical protein
MDRRDSPRRESWPLIWFGSFLLSLAVFDRGEFDTSLKWLFVAALWLGVWLYWKFTDAASQAVPATDPKDPYVRGALQGGLAALVTAAVVTWAIPSIARITVDDEGPSLASIFAMVATYLLARQARIGELRDQPREAPRPEPEPASPSKTPFGW